MIFLNAKITLIYFQEKTCYDTFYKAHKKVIKLCCLILSVIMLLFSV
jgi:hypothetical protein